MAPWGDGLPGSLEPTPSGGWGDGLPLGPSTIGPKVVTAVAIDETTVRLTYDKEVKHVAAGNVDDALNPANYAFTGGLVATGVVLFQASPTIVDINVAPDMEHINYTVTVSAVQDLAGNVIDPLYDSAAYLGPGVAPIPEAHDFVAEILIGSEVIWSATNAVPQQTLTFDVRKYLGKLPLTFRIRGVS